VPYFDSDGIKIYYEVRGEGEPVVLLNGIFMNTASWATIAGSLSKFFKVVLHDMRGQWKSEKPADRREYSFRHHARDLYNLLNHLGLERAHLIGTSYGGEVALRFALEHPEMVRSLSVICSVSEIGLETKLAALRWMQGALTRDPKAFVYSWINDVYSDDFLARAGEGFIEQLIRAYSSTDFSYDAAVNLLSAFLELEIEPITPRLREIEAPTLFVAAEKDRIKPPKYSRVMAESVRNSELVIISNAGHALVVEKPLPLSWLLIGFLLRQMS